MMKHFILQFILITINSFSYCQGELDSLSSIYMSSNNDSVKSRICLKIGDYYESIDIDKSIKWGKEAVTLAKKFGDQEYLVRAINYAASFYYAKGDHHKQIEEYLKAYRIAERNEFYDLQGGLASNLGVNYDAINDSVQGLLWLNKSVELKQRYSTPQKLAKSYTNLGDHYFRWNSYNKAIEYFNLALEIERNEGNLSSIANILGNLADCYVYIDDFEHAEKLMFEAFKLLRELDDAYLLCRWYMNSAWLYRSQDQNTLGLVYSDTALSMAREYSYDRLHQEILSIRGQIFSDLGDYKSAYETELESFTLWKAQNALEAAENLNELQTKYETEKVQNENLLLKKDSEIDAAMISNQRLVIWASGGGLFILVIMIYFLNKWNKEKKKQNVLLAEQRDLVETKNTEILDSIQYAKRIQAAILPPRKMMDEVFDDYFVFYRPKDVVAGDFYWVEKYKDHLLFAAADCTGHGVPGALVSVFCHNGLNRSVREEGITDPGKILDNTRKILLKEFEKSEEEVKDGMDIALCSYDGKTLKFAGANNHLWLIRNGECFEYRADKQPIGQTENAKNFTSQAVDTKPGDIVYLFSDGYADQFGGEQGKKMKSAVFKKFLMSISNQSLKDQSLAIEKHFLNWMGNEEQLDDVCVFAVRF